MKFWCSLCESAAHTTGYHMHELNRENDDLKAKLAVAVEALNYYSTQSPTDIASDCDFADSCGFTVFKQGKRAREALKAIGGE